MLYVVSYDIPGDKRRSKVHKILKNYGVRVQYSVFECQLENNQVQELRGRLMRVVKAATDSVRLYRVCRDCMAQTIVIGSAPPSEEPAYWIV